MKALAAKPGVGRPPKPKSKAGRPPGSVNKISKEAVQKAAEGGILPLDYLLGVMRDKGADEKRRDAAAMAAAPFCHHRLSSITHSGSVTLTHEEALAALK